MRGSALEDRRFTTSFISAPVEQQVVQRLQELSEDQLLEMWTNFSKFGNARGMTRSIFEAFIHRRFRTRIDLHAQPMMRTTRINSRWHASSSTKRPRSATVLGVAQLVLPLQVDVGSTSVYVLNTALIIEPDIYYMPQSDQQPALDSFILHGGHLYVFQCTGGQAHKINDALVGFLATCSGLPPRTNWHFIFIIPDDLLSFSCPSSSNSVIRNLGLYTATIPM